MLSEKDRKFFKKRYFYLSDMQIFKRLIIMRTEMNVI